MHHPQPHCFDATDADHHHYCDSHRGLFTHPYAMPNTRSVHGLPPGHHGHGASPLGSAYDHGGGRTGPNTNGGDGSGGVVITGSNGGQGFGNHGPGPGPEEGGQRKRIPVACGRCRKRKIRCSGDSGNGEPCSNCRSAGYTPCQFLRVQSHDPHNSGRDQGFGYNVQSSRQFQARGPLPSNHYGTTNGFDGLVAAATGDAASHHLSALPYRTGSAYTHGSAAQAHDTPRSSSYMSSWVPATATHAETDTAEPQTIALHPAASVHQGTGTDNGNSTAPPPSYVGHTHTSHPALYHPVAFHPSQEARFMNPYSFSHYTIAGHPSAAVTSLATLATRPSPAVPVPPPNGGEHPGSFTYNHHMTHAQAHQDANAEANAAPTTQDTTSAVGAVAPASSPEATSPTGVQHQSQLQCQQHLPRNDSASSLASYGRATTSPATSMHNATPASSSYDNYSPSPVSGYAHMVAGNDQSSVRSADIYTTSPKATASSESGNGYSSSSGGYVYHDTTAAAALAAASNRRATPENVDGRAAASDGTDAYGPPPALNTNTTPFALAPELHEDADQGRTSPSMRQ